MQNFYAWESFGALTILVLIISYLIISVNVQRSPRVQHYGSIQKERKLSVTLQVNIWKIISCLHISNIIISHRNFRSNHSAPGYLRIHPRGYKGQMTQCVKVWYSWYSSCDIFCQFHSESSCIRHTNAGIWKSIKKPCIKTGLSRETITESRTEKSFSFTTWNWVVNFNWKRRGRNKPSFQAIWDQETKKWSQRNVMIMFLYVCPGWKTSTTL